MLVGRLLNAGKRTKVSGYLRAGKSIEFVVPDTLSSHKCLSYTLAQEGVCCVVTGPSTVDEVNDSLSYFDKGGSDYGKELSEILAQLR